MAVVTGTTQDSYPSDPALTWDLSDLYADRKTIVIVNTGSTNNLDYRITIKADKNGSYEAIENTDTLGPGDSALINIRNPRAVITVNVKSTTSGNSTTFEIQTMYSRGVLP